MTGKTSPVSNAGWFSSWFGSSSNNLEKKVEDKKDDAVDGQGPNNITLETSPQEQVKSYSSGEEKKDEDVKFEQETHSSIPVEEEEDVEFLDKFILLEDSELPIEKPDIDLVEKIATEIEKLDPDSLKQCVKFLAGQQKAIIEIYHTRFNKMNRELEDMKREIRELRGQKASSFANHPSSASSPTLQSTPIDPIEIAFRYIRALRDSLTKKQVSAKLLFNYFSKKNDEKNYRFYKELTEEKKEAVKNFMAGELFKFLENKKMFFEPRFESDGNNLISIDPDKLNSWLTSNKYSEEVEQFILQYGLPKRDDLIELTARICFVIALDFNIKENRVYDPSSFFPMIDREFHDLSVLLNIQQNMKDFYCEKSDVHDICDKSIKAQIDSFYEGLQRKGIEAAQRRGYAERIRRSSPERDYKGQEDKGKEPQSPEVVASESATRQKGVRSRQKSNRGRTAKWRRKN